MPSDRATAGLVAAALSYSLAYGTPQADETHRALLDMASLYRRSSSDGVSLCTYCGQPVRSVVGDFRRVEGWAEIRRKGGTHALVDQRPTGEVACSGCMRARRLGIAAEQRSLLD